MKFISANFIFFIICQSSASAFSTREIIVGMTNKLNIVMKLSSKMKSKYLNVQTSLMFNFYVQREKAYSENAF